MIYGLIAVGYTMVYGIIGMINFAHGDVFMIGAFLSLIALTGLSALGITSVPLALALTLVFAACAIAALYGWTIERIAYRPLRGSFRLAPLISRHRHVDRAAEFRPGLARARATRTDAAADPGRGPLMEQGGLRRPAVLDADRHRRRPRCCCSAGVHLAGHAHAARPRACAPASRTSRWPSLLGIDTDRTISLTFVIGAALAAVAGLLFLLYYGVDRFLHRLHRGRQSVHRGGAGRHRQPAGRGAGRPRDRPDRELSGPAISSVPNTRTSPRSRCW